MYEDIAIELARTVRECTDVVERRLRDRQLGEAWIDIPDGVNVVDDRRTVEGDEVPSS